MKNRLCFFILLGMGIMLATVALNGDQAAARTDVKRFLKPDLAMGKIWIVKAGLTTLTHPPLPVTVLKKGEKYLLTCQYSNPGGALNGFWKLGYYIDGEMVMNQSWGNVPAGATQTKYAEYTPTAVGSRTYSCRLDYDKEVVEKDETNNKASLGFTVIQ
jgi:subtilase family serine protease